MVGLCFPYASVCRKELGLNVTEANRYLSQWGPCTRTILDLLSLLPFASRTPLERQYVQEAQAAAEVICAHPLAYAYPETLMAPSVGFA